MSCERFNPQPGDFINRGWGIDNFMDTSRNILWELLFEQDTEANTFGYRLMGNRQNYGKITFQIPQGHTRNEYSMQWIFFGGGKFLAIYKVSGDNPKRYEIRICDLRNLSPNPNPLPEIHHNSFYLSLNAGEILQFDELPPNGLAFFICIISGDGTRSRRHLVYRTDNIYPWCGCEEIGTISDPVAGTRSATVTETLGVKIFTKNNGQKTYWHECPQLTGLCFIEPQSQDFGEVVIGAPPERSTTQRIFSVVNYGGDVLEFTSIQNVQPFTVISISKTLPACVNSLEYIDVTVKFEPSDVGSFEVDLPVTYNPQIGDNKIHCTGRARKPAARLVVKQRALDFGQVPEHLRSVRTVLIGNKGDAQLVFLAHIEGQDANLFGLTLDPPNGSISNVVSQRLYVVSSQSPYDGTASGSGILNMKVVFKAIGSPRRVRAQINFYGPFNPQDPHFLDLHRRDDIRFDLLPKLYSLPLIGEVGPPLVPIIPS